MQNDYPPSRVLIAKSLPTKFVVSDNITYVDIYTQEERDAIIAKYKTPNLFNGVSIRLDNITFGTCYLSTCMFYDFLCCNIVGIHNKDPLAWNKLNRILKTYGKLDTFEKVIAINELPNLLCTSVLLHDINDDYLLVERNTKVSVGSGLFACSSSGSLTIEDCITDNPIVSCAQRELIEELNLNVSVYIQGVIMPLQKLQPVALLTGQVQMRWSDIIDKLKLGIDYEKENSKLLVVPKRFLLPIISMYKFTDAASFHIFHEVGGSKEKWIDAARQVISINSFYV